MLLLWSDPEKPGFGLWEGKGRRRPFAPRKGSSAQASPACCSLQAGVGPRSYNMHLPGLVFCALSSVSLKNLRWEGGQGEGRGRREAFESPSPFHLSLCKYDLHCSRKSVWRELCSKAETSSIRGPTSRSTHLRHSGGQKRGAEGLTVCVCTVLAQDEVTHLQSH